MTTWTPTHPATAAAWAAVVTNLQNRANRGLWGSRNVAISIAASFGLTHERATDLIRSAINHGYLEERPSPLGAGHTSQIRLPEDGAR